MRDQLDMLKARHQIAINWRLAGNYAVSKVAFETLMHDLRAHPELAGMLGRVYRDYGMLMVDMGSLIHATPYIRESMRLLNNPENGNKLGDSSLILAAEYANSLGFMARVRALQGDLAVALDMFERVDEALRPHRPRYDDARINNAVWWFKWLSPIERWKLAPSLILLALRTSRVKKTRAVELIVLAIFGRRGYDRLRRFVR